MTKLKYLRCKSCKGIFRFLVRTGNSDNIFCKVCRICHKKENFEDITFDVFKALKEEVSDDE